MFNSGIFIVLLFRLEFTITVEEKENRTESHIFLLAISHESNALETLKHLENIVFLRCKTAVVVLAKKNLSWDVFNVSIFSLCLASLKVSLKPS